MFRICGLTVRQYSDSASHEKIHEKLDRMSKDIVGLQTHNKTISDSLEKDNKEISDSLDINLNFMSKSLRFQDEKIASHANTTKQDIEGIKQETRNKLVELYSQSQQTFLFGVASLPILSSSNELTKCYRPLLQRSGRPSSSPYRIDRT